MPLGSELAKRLSLGGSSDVITVPPRQFYVGGLSHKILGMIESNFVPGSPGLAPVVLNVRNWETGAMDHWTAYEVQTSYGRTFKDLATIGSQLANRVWLLALLSFVALLIDASALSICIRLGRDIAMAIDDLSGAAQQIARGNFAWRTPLRSKDQIGETNGQFSVTSSLPGEVIEQSPHVRVEPSDVLVRLVGERIAGRSTPDQLLGAGIVEVDDQGSDLVWLLGCGGRLQTPSEAPTPAPAAAKIVVIGA